MVTRKDLALVLRKLEDVAAHWKKYGLALNVKQAKLDQIQANNPGNDDMTCMIELLQIWHRRRVARTTWKALHDVAETIGSNPTARAISEKFSPGLDIEGTFSSIYGTSGIIDASVSIIPGYIYNIKMAWHTKPVCDS